MSTVENNRKIIAQKIADRLFKNACGEVALRLVLHLQGDRNGGGWVKPSAIKQIEEVLNETDY